MASSKDLQDFYNSEAKKYHQTRKKHRADGILILEKLHSLKLKNPKILELGCGGGRLTTLLNKSYKSDFSYTGVDISKKLLQYAKEDNSNNEFICLDMLSFLQSCKQETFDSIIACASFQHLTTQEERLAVMKNAYRALSYEGILIFTNWAFSEWFLKKHWKIISRSGIKYLFTLGKKSWRDVLIPRTSKNGTQYRYYHLFSLEELRKLAELSGFIVEELCYLNPKGEKITDWKKANNSFLIARKAIAKEE